VGLSLEEIFLKLTGVDDGLPKDGDPAVVPEETAAAEGQESSAP
jgi:hypothetical protein